RKSCVEGSRYRGDLPRWRYRLAHATCAAGASVHASLYKQRSLFATDGAHSSSRRDYKCGIGRSCDLRVGELNGLTRLTPWRCFRLFTSPDTAKRHGVLRGSI